MTIADSSLPIYTTINELNERAMNAVSKGEYEHALALGTKAARLATIYVFPLEKGRALWNIGWAYSNLLRYEDALTVLGEAADIFQEVGDAFGISRVLQGIGNVYFSTGRLLESLEEYLNAYAVLELAGLERNSIALLGNIAYTYKLLGEYYYAIEYAQKQLTLALHFSNEFHISKALNSLGSNYFHLGDYATSLSYYSQGFHRATDKKDIDAESWILGNISSVYLQLGNYTGALDSMMQCIALSEHTKDRRHLAHCYNQVCSIYRTMGNDSLALDYAMRSLSIYTTLCDRVGEANVLMNIARIFNHNGDSGIALDYAQKSYRLHCESSTKEGEAESLLLISSAHHQMNHYPLAIEAAEAALVIAENINSHALLLSALQQLLDLADIVKDSSRAEVYSQRLDATSTIIAKEEQRTNAQKLMLEAQLQKTRTHAEKLLTNTKNTLSADFLHKTSSLKQQGLVLAPDSLPTPVKASNNTRAISIHTFGHFDVTINGREISNENWQRKKARDIFKILLIHHQQSVSADELIDTLWTDTTGRNLIPTLWNCVTYIRKALEPKLKPREPSTYIKIAGKNYLLDLGSGAEIDFIAFKDLLARGNKQKSLLSKIQLYEQAVELYQGDFLKEDAFEEWASYERESMKELYLHAMIEIGNFHAYNGNLPDAITFARRAIETDRVYEEGYELLFTALAGNNQTSELFKAWKSCQLFYNKELGSTPPTFLEKLVLL